VPVLAQEETRLLNHSFIGSEHLLLGLIHEEGGIAAQALRSLGITLEAAREKAAETIGTVITAPSGSPSFTPRTKKVLELSLREAMQLGHEGIGTEHLLLGLVREGEGVAAQVLVSLGADLLRVRQQVIQLMSRHPGTETTGPADLRGAHVAKFGQQGTTGERPRWRRCALCGRSLWETAHFVVGTEGRVCEECIRSAARLLENAAAGARELVLPPRVSGQPPSAAVVASIVAAIDGVFGPDADRSTWETTNEEPERFAPLLEQAVRQWGNSEKVHVAQVGFVTPELAYVRVRIVFPRGSETTVSGQLCQHGDRWLLTAETLVAVLGLAGIPIDEEPAEVVDGAPPDDRTVDEVATAIRKVFGGDRQPGDQATISKMPMSLRRTSRRRTHACPR